MNERDVLQTLEALAHQHLNFVGTLKPGAMLAETVAQDSLARTTLLVEVENKFHICIDDDEAMALRTAADVVALVMKHGGASKPLGNEVPAP